MIRNQTAGVMFVRPTSNLDMTDLSDVQITTPATNQFLVYVGNRWENTALDISLDTTPALGGNLAGAGFNISNVGNISATGNISAQAVITNSISSDDSTILVIEDGLDVKGDIDATGNITAGNVEVTEQNDKFITAFGTLGYNSDRGAWGLESTGGFGSVDLTSATIDNETGNVTAQYTVSVVNDGRLVLPESSEANVAKLTSPPNNANVSLQLYSGNAVRIVSNSAGEPFVWTFGTTGSFTAPGNISAVGNITGDNLITSGVIDLGSNASIYTNSGGANNLYIDDDNEVWLSINDGTNSVTLDATGNLKVTIQEASGNSVNVNFSVLGNGVTQTNTSIETTGNISTTGNVSVGNTLTVSGVAVMSTQAPVGGSSETPTALSLAKSVQILDGSNYSLANGVEGQIMYFVPATGNTRGSAVIVANARRWDYSDTGNAVIEQNLTWFCFDNVIAVLENNDTYAVSMAIFTDGAWNLQGGSKD
jgi:hypothetical protein